MAVKVADILVFMKEAIDRVRGLIEKHGLSNS